MTEILKQNEVQNLFKKKQNKTCVCVCTRAHVCVSVFVKIKREEIYLQTSYVKSS